MSDLSFRISQNSNNFAPPDGQEEIGWQDFASSYQTTLGDGSLVTLDPSPTVDSASGSVAISGLTFAQNSFATDATSKVPPASIVWSNGGATATFASNLPWNTLKDAEVTQFSGTTLNLVNFVDVNVQLGGDAGETVYADGAKRGEIDLLGNGNNTVHIGEDNNTPDTQLNGVFHVNLGDGNNHVVFGPASKHYADPSTAKAPFGGVNQPEDEVLNVSVGAGNNVIDAGTGGEAAALFLKGNRSQYTIAPVIAGYEYVVTGPGQSVNTIYNVQTLHFADTTLALPISPPKLPRAYSPTLTVPENAAAAAIGISAPTDPNFTQGQLAITAGTQPADGTVTLQDGTAVTGGEQLTIQQLTELQFTPTPGLASTSSTFSYTVTDPAGNAAVGTATLVIGPATPTTPASAPGGDTTSGNAISPDPGTPANGTSAPAAPIHFQIVDTTAGGTILPDTGTPYSGPAAGLQWQLITTTTDSLAITALTPNNFIHAGPGTDAIDVSHVNGTNVLDGAGGSNFLVGGTGFDTFFIDGRSPAPDSFSTVAGFHSGDNATVWGVTPSDFQLNTSDNQGAAGYTGLDFSLTAAGQPNVNLVLAGFTSADLTNGRLSVSYGTTATGDAAGSTFMLIHAN